MEFIPRSITIPTILRTAQFTLLPLQATHNELDYEAVMASREMLNLMSHGAWPSSDFSLADNLRDLERHDAEHTARKCFTYTVLDPAESTCLGCVYISPLKEVLKSLKADDEIIAGLTGLQAVVNFWVRQSEQRSDQDLHLLEALLDWFEDDWPQCGWTFESHTGDKHRLRLMARVGLRLSWTLESHDGKRINCFFR